MKFRLLQLLLAVALVLGGYWWGHSSITVVHAQQQLRIPKAWGKVVAAQPGFFFLEDASGTIRVYDTQSGGLDVIVTRN